MKLENYERDFSEYKISSYSVNSHLISRFDTLIVPGENGIMVAEIYKNGQVCIYKQIENNDLSRIRRKSSRKKMDADTRLYQ